MADSKQEAKAPDFDFTVPDTVMAPPKMTSGGDDFNVKTQKFTNVADDWVPPRRASNRGTDRQPRMRSSVKALKLTTNNANLTSNWFGQSLGDKFWVPSKRAVDSDTMRMIASKEYPASTMEYRDADIFACGGLPSQYAPPKREALGQMHPPDLVDAVHPTSLKVMSKEKYGKEVNAWDSTVRDTVSQKLWRIRESVK
ncbi:hypothetical protein TL16_g07036 [Triparma laevis f. inornata]|uniref:Uncharacterized protein n=1 Tax=Triparma laevis f. inornata TaxID=1714386 RepID=A0A9W7ATH5_9STRA|nr:hypothetical protein TL16_g07036 [Triparma laevis f. inornata]